MLRYVYLVFLSFFCYVSFLSIFFFLFFPLVRPTGANDRYFLFHLHCHVYNNVRTIHAQFSPYRQNKNTFQSLLSRAHCFGTFLSIQFAPLYTLLCHSIEQTRMQHIHFQFSFCLLSIFFEFCCYFFHFFSSTAPCSISVFFGANYQICIDR